MDRMAGRLENMVGLSLRIDGRTVSSAGTATEVEILGYEFRASALPPPRINEARGGGRLKFPCEADERNRPRLIQQKPGTG